MNDLWCWAIYTDLRPEPQFPHLQYKANNTYALELYLRFRDQISYIAYGSLPETEDIDVGDLRRV